MSTANFFKFFWESKRWVGVVYNCICPFYFPGLVFAVLYVSSWESTDIYRKTIPDAKDFARWLSLPVTWLMSPQSFLRAEFHGMLMFHYVMDGIYHLSTRSKFIIMIILVFFWFSIFSDFTIVILFELLPFVLGVIEVIFNHNLFNPSTSCRDSITIFIIQW